MSTVLATRAPILELLRRETLAEGTEAFHFSRPAGFAFRAGQAIDLVLPDPAGGEPMRHAFSIASAPGEDEIVIATRMRPSAYKNVLATLDAGTKVEIDGPFGELKLRKDASRPLLFVAGGIGITPFRSMLRQARLERRTQRMVLVYANRRPEDAAWLDELRQMACDTDRFRLVATMTRPQESARAWGGATGPVDASLIRRACERLEAPECYVAGPPAMVAAARTALAAAGIDEDDIHGEEFFGY